MILRSYAKINLSLVVNKKLNNGLHDLQSIYSLISLHDTISIKTIKNKKKDLISIKGPFSKYVNKSNNSVRKVLNLMRKYKLISNFYQVKIYKKIPVFAGFGGGTSNAAVVLRFLNKKKIEKAIFEKISKIVGSDFKLFFFKHGIVKNLKNVEELSHKFKFHVLLVYPRINCSTKTIYSLVKNFSKKTIFSQKKYKTRRKFIKHLVNSNNDLQLIVEKKYPVIKRLLSSMNASKNSYYSRMTGSGSGCYALFADKNSSKVALKKLRKKYPKFWFSIAKTI